MKYLSFTIIFFLIPLLGFAQAKKPTIMVLPDDVWCSSNGYMQTFENQGEVQNIPNYSAALQNNMDLKLVITKIGELMSERGFDLIDLSSQLSNIKNELAEDAVMQSNTSGASVAESPYDRLMKTAKADILMKISWTVNKMGPKNSITYIIQGIDAYTNKQIAAASGTGAQSFASELSILIEEATIEKMDQFASQLQTHFDDLLANGREVSVQVKVFNTGSGLNLETEYNGEELGEIIEKWMSDNTVGHRFSTTDATSNFMSFTQVRIPIVNEKGRPLDCRGFATQLKKFLNTSPLTISSKVVTKGLGKATLILGEK